MFRFAFRYLAGTLAFPLADYLLFGLWCRNLEVALLAGAVLMLFYLLLRPLARLMLLAFNVLTLGLLGTALDTGLIMLTVRLFPGDIAVKSVDWAFWAALIINVVRAITGGMVRAR